MEIDVKNEMYNDAKKRLEDTKCLVEKYPNMATLQFSLKNWTEMVEHLDTEICHFIESYLTKCEFSDECDTCGNPKEEQSWALMSGCETNEVDRCLCQTCAIVLVKEWKAEDEAFETKIGYTPTP